MMIAFVPSIAKAQAGSDDVAILIGFNSYAKLPDVPSQSKDLPKLADVLKKQCGFDSVNVFVDSEQPGAVGRIEQAVQTATSRARSGRLLVLLSGYAFENSSGDPVLAVPDTDPDDVTGFELKTVGEALENLSVNTQVLLFIDCCKRSGSQESPIGMTNDVLLNAFSGAKNLIAVAASGADQQSHIDPDKGSSVFTSVLTDALRGAADSDENSSITANELFRKLFGGTQEACAPLGVLQLPLIRTSGKASKDDVVTRYVKSAPLRKIDFVNLENSPNALLYLRHGLERLTVTPGQRGTIACESVNEVEYYTGISRFGRSGWRALYAAPADTYEFRMARQIGGDLEGKQAWTAGFTNSLGVHLTLIDPGRFLMGRNSYDDAMFRAAEIDPATYSFSIDSELPAHEVRITRPFYMGTHEVTTNAFGRFSQKVAYRSDAEKKGYENSVYLDGSGSFSKKTGLSWHTPGMAQDGRHPAVHITHNDATRFCAYLTLEEKGSYALPTEAQWEYAARAGTRTSYWPGNNPEQLASIGNVRDGTLGSKFPAWSDTLTNRDGYVYTAPVGSFPANPFGLHDIHGNVWEWCADWYSDSYFKTSPRNDPTGPDTGELRAYRGGCFY